MEFDTNQIQAALTQIGQIVDRSESDPTALADMLREIKELAQEGIDAYIAERDRIRDAEIVALRAFRNAAR